MRMLEDISCHHPKTTAEAVELLSSEATRGKILSGGTDLIVQWQAGAVPLPSQAISLLAIPELSTISETDTHLTIGACITHATLKQSPAVREHLPALAQACGTVGALQIQNRGTLGGNIANASPAGDTPPALLITNGDIVVAGPEGERRIALNEFFLGYRTIDLQENEIIVRVELPKKPKAAIECFHKLGTRGAQAISKVMTAVRIEKQQDTIKSIRIAMGSVAATTIRLRKLEEWLKGKPLTEETLSQAEILAAEEVTPIADIRSTAQYRRWVSGRIIRGMLREIR